MFRVTSSLFTLLNLAYDPTNYPAFFFSKVIPDILQYVKSPDFDQVSTAKFILSCMHSHLDCDQLLALTLDEKEAEYCVSTLIDALQSPVLKGDGFAVHEILQILTNLTHPSHSTVESVCESMTTQKGKLILVPDYYDQKLIIAAMELAKSCHCLIKHDLIPVLEGMVREKKFLSSASRILWNLLHHQGIKNKIAPEICEILQDSTPQEDQLSIHCCLWLLGKTDEKGTQCQ